MLAVIGAGLGVFNLVWKISDSSPRIRVRVERSSSSPLTVIRVVASNQRNIPCEVMQVGLIDGKGERISVGMIGPEVSIAKPVVIGPFGSKEFLFDRIVMTWWSKKRWKGVYVMTGANKEFRVGIRKLVKKCKKENAWLLGEKDPLPVDKDDRGAAG